MTTVYSSEFMTSNKKKDYIVKGNQLIITREEKEDDKIKIVIELNIKKWQENQKIERAKNQVRRKTEEEKHTTFVDEYIRAIKRFIY